jgi:endo-1,4-beta-D-glucanase Y
LEGKGMRALCPVVLSACLGATVWACSGSAASVAGGQGNDGGTSSSSGGGAGDAGHHDAGDAGNPKGPDGGKNGADGGHPTDGGNVGDDGSTVTDRCFGSHSMQYPSDVLMPSGAQADLDAKTAAAYDQWKAQYVKQGCGGYYVLSGGGTGTDVGDEVSEGHGYGMVITALMACHDPDAKKIFDGMYAFFKKFPTTGHQNLMAWTVQVAAAGGSPGCQIPTGQSDSATDGDLDIAFALLLADKQWPGNGYLAKAQAVIADIANGDLNPTTHLSNPGDWDTNSPDNFKLQGDGAGANYYYGTRPSDFMLDHFRSFGNAMTAAADKAAWSSAVDATYGVADAIQTKFSPSTGLLPDFIVDTNTSPRPAPSNYLEAPTDGEYSWNSCRVPWHIATDYVVSSDPRAKKLLTLMNTWVVGATGGDPGQIVSGYALGGAPIPGQSPSSPFTSPFGVAAMAGTDQAWLDAIWNGMAVNQGYYGDSITLLSMIVMSGNWWAP